MIVKVMLMIERWILSRNGGIIMQLLFRTWNHIIPLAIVTNKTLKIGDVVEIKGQKYYVNCEPKTVSPSGKKIRFYYCVKATKDAEVTNKVNR
jgi:hypothetical protein